MLREVEELFGIEPHVGRWVTVGPDLEVWMVKETLLPATREVFAWLAPSLLSPGSWSGFHYTNSKIQNRATHAWSRFTYQNIRS